LTQPTRAGHLALSLALPSPLERIDPAPLEVFFEGSGPELWVKRDDLIHPLISGNKWRKLAGVFEGAGAGAGAGVGEPPHLITFGGGRSNYLVAASAAARAAGWGITCVVRGEELAARALSPHLARCVALGARLVCVPRGYFAALREGGWRLTAEEVSAWGGAGGGARVVGEGGAGEHTLSGCAALWAELEAQREGRAPFDELWLSAGTGATACGLLEAMPAGHPTRVVAVSAARGAWRESEAVAARAGARGLSAEWVDEGRFGGFARGLERSQRVAERFEGLTGVWVDPVYNAKLLAELAARAPRLTGRRVLWVHTGGFRG
jgi:1-aminocyclopropane-1-carboxylate deaminase